MNKNLQDLNIQSEEDLEQKPKDKNMQKKVKIALIALVVVLLGVGSGYGLSSQGFFSSSNTKKSTNAKNSSGEITVEKGTVVGTKDEDTFKDTAEGKLKKGGIDGEGSHHLERPGGEARNVYMTSSIIDLDKFVGRQVKVWGETFAGQKAGWLMDVGRLKVLN
jgi:hypothetical protein